MTTFLLKFPTKEDQIENIITTPNEGSRFIKRLLMTIDRIDCEKNTEIVIESKNKDDFIGDYKTLENLLNIRIGAYNLEDILLIYFSDFSIKIANTIDANYDYTYSIDNFNAINDLFSGLNYDRRLNRYDFRHCENHPNKDREKSPLIGGISGFDNAQALLFSAIGDKKSNKKIIINIDDTNGKFIIRFEDENFNNQYHAYHIVKNNNGNYIEDKQEIEKIKTSLNRAFKLIKYRNEIKNES